MILHCLPVRLNVWRAMSTVIGCRLVSVEGLHKPIQLVDRTPFVIGRQRQFKIKDVTCSKKQVEITPDFKNKLVVVKNLGSNPATINSRLLSENAKLTDGEILHLALDKIPYKVEFNCTVQEVENGKARADLAEEKTNKRKSSPNLSVAPKKAKLEEEQDDDVGAKLRQMREAFSKVPKEEDKPPRSTPISSGITSKASTSTGWRKRDTLMVYKSEGVLDSVKIAAFDMDGTIITTKSGRVFPTSPADWQILYSEIPKTLKQLHKDGYKIVFITNQLGISRGKMSEPEFRDKAEAIIKHLGCPVHVHAATSTGTYRKPALGSWLHLVENENAGLEVDMISSFYCGDAAGRPEDKGKKRKKDHSCSDRLFALNSGLRFVTPEEYFLGEKARSFTLPEFDSKKLCDEGKDVDPSKLLSTKPEMIVNVGFPASGKSHFSKTHLVPAGYVYASRDEIGTWQKCVALCREALKSGKSVVVDNTNPDVESRSRYTAVAEACSVPCRCFYFPATFSHAKHNETFRQLTDSKHSRIPDMVMHSYKSKFAMPTVAEGFKEIVHVPFVPRFKNESDENLYKLYLLEK